MLEPDLVDQVEAAAGSVDALRTVHELTDVLWLCRQVHVERHQCSVCLLSAAPRSWLKQRAQRLPCRTDDTAASDNLLTVANKTHDCSFTTLFLLKTQRKSKRTLSNFPTLLTFILNHS